MNKQRIALIRIKGKPGLNKTLKSTLQLLRLYKKHNCVVIENTPQYIGMIEQVKEVITWGEIDEQTFRALLEKRGRLPGTMKLTKEYLKAKCNTDFETFTKEFMACKRELKDIPGLKLFFKLNPPVHGFERKGLKVPYSLGGVVGYRKDKINGLLARMM